MVEKRRLRQVIALEPPDHEVAPEQEAHPHPRVDEVGLAGVAIRRVADNPVHLRRGVQKVDDPGVALVPLIFAAGIGWTQLQDVHERLDELEGALDVHAERGARPVAVQRLEALELDVQELQGGDALITTQLSEIRIQLARLCQAQDVDC